MPLSYFYETLSTPVFNECLIVKPVSIIEVLISVSSLLQIKFYARWIEYFMNVNFIDTPCTPT